MFFHFKKGFIVGLAVISLNLFSVVPKEAFGYSPTNSGGDFGIGLEVGDPGDWGISGKLWVDRRNAFQGAVKTDGGTAILQLDYLWHNFEMIHLRGNGGEMPFYIGLGGDLVTGDSALFAGRLPIGLSYIFNKRDFPVDLFLQVVPTLWFYQDRTSFYLYTEGGIHIYP